MTLVQVTGLLVCPTVKRSSTATTRWRRRQNGIICGQSYSRAVSARVRRLAKQPPSLSLGARRVPLYLCAAFFKVVGVGVGRVAGLAVALTLGEGFGVLSEES
jgi:hypothetical protein